ncbi:MAG TPA: hypothetical protein HPP54_08080 [Nitrospinae bacterium]|jgi:hypothetical protein|nr:hypothetical protein [Nitrospinota bacterium]
MEDTFDFGFTALDEDELDVVQSATQTATELEGVRKELDEAKETVIKLHESIQPLLNNLSANPTKPYIYWADRLEKIEQFRTHLQKIVSKHL